MGIISDFGFRIGDLGLARSFNPQSEIRNSKFELQCQSRIFCREHAAPYRHPSILIIGSGPIVIGRGASSITPACKLVGP